MNESMNDCYPFLNEKRSISMDDRARNYNIL